MYDLSQYIQQGKKYYIYGTKYIGDYCFNIIKEKSGDMAVIGFIETEPTAAECCGKKIYALKDMKPLDDDTYIVLAAANAYETMKCNLINRGISSDKIIIPIGLYPYFKNILSFKGERIQKVCFWPLIREADQDIQKKISWFLPDKAEITIWCEENIQENFQNNVCIADCADVEKKFDEADAVYVWNMTGEADVSKNYLDKTYIVDPHFYKYTETNNYTGLYYKALSESDKKSFLDKSKKVFCRLKTDNKAKRANVFCSGPSIEEIDGAEFDTDLNMITNSMVKDKTFLEKIKPKILFFADANFYMSPHDYCKKFYEDVLEAVEKYDLYIVVFEYRMPLILQHFPMLKDRMIGMPFGAREFTFPDQNNFCTKGTSNILTELVLPVASALCDEIGIAGCTGRNPDETTYYWRHNPNTQYLDLMQSVFDMYPSVFRDQKYDDYYDRHCKTVQDIIEYGEGMGKKYINLTTSFIPALKERTKNA